MEKVKKVRSMIDRDLMMTKLLMGIFGFFGMIMVVYGFMYTLALMFLGMIYMGLVYLALGNRRESGVYLKKIRRYLAIDIDKALETLENEVGFLQDTINAPKKEMDIHSLNATNEGKAMRASLRNEIALKKRLGKFIVMRDLMREHVRSINKKEVTAWDE